MNCRLCLQPKELRKSHIISEFFYKPVYIESHKLKLIPNFHGIKKYRNLQKGIREKLLCNECEQLRSSWEKYVRDVFFGSEIEALNTKTQIKIRNLEYQQFKLFGLSLIWLASISSEPFFSYINLGPHEEKVRKMIFKRDPGLPHEYGLMIIAVSLNNTSIEDLIMQPDEIRVDGHRCLRFFLGSCLWLFNVSSHSHLFGGKNYFLQKDGSLIVPKKTAENLELFQKFALQVTL